MVSALRVHVVYLFVHIILKCLDRWQKYSSQPHYMYHCNVLVRLLWQLDIYSNLGKIWLFKRTDFSSQSSVRKKIWKYMLNFKVILSWYWGMKHKIAKCAVRRKEFVFFCLENASQIHESSRRNWSRRAIALRTETLALLLVEFFKTQNGFIPISRQSDCFSCTASFGIH